MQVSRRVDLYRAGRGLMCAVVSMSMLWCVGCGGGGPIRQAWRVDGRAVARMYVRSSHGLSPVYWAEMHVRDRKDIGIDIISADGRDERSDAVRQYRRLWWSGDTLIVEGAPRWSGGGLYIRFVPGPAGEGDE